MGYWLTRRRFETFNKRLTRARLRVKKGSLLTITLLVLSCLVFIGCGLKNPDSLTPPAAGTHLSEEPPEGLIEGLFAEEGPLSPITGKPLVEEGSPVAVSIGNNPSARPQSGLASADVVYEVLAEGGITRYLALYHSQAPKTVGPIRSARPYLALLAKEWGAIFGHCGGDPKDLEPIKEWGVVDADELFGRGDLFWRSADRVPPDNLYASIGDLRKAVSTSLPAPFHRYDFEPWVDKPAQVLHIDYGQDYMVEYRYSPDDDAYERFVIDSGKELQQKDLDTQDRVLVSNVVVQFASSKVVYSDGGLIIDLIGEDKALYLLGGRWEKGTWEKQGVSEITFFYDSGGVPIKLAPGQTWIQIVPQTAKVELIQE